jgi:hypothetical protein
MKTILRDGLESDCRVRGPGLQGWAVGRVPSRGGATRGLTILEMLVSTAMLTFIVLGLTAMFIQTQRAFKTGIKATTITDAGRTVMDMIASDMRQMSDAANTNVYNLYWTNSESFVQYDNGAPFRTNQIDEIYVLEHTNTTWLGVGYAVLNLVPNSGTSVGTLYRYQTNFNSPYLIRDPSAQFIYDIETQQFTNQAYWHRVADGVISLSLRAYDQNGNEPWVESTFYGDYATDARIFYPLPSFNNQPASNTLPNAVDVELAVLEPDALAQARSLAGAPSALNSFMTTNALTRMEVFRRRISIPVVSR